MFKRTFLTNLQMEMFFPYCLQKLFLLIRIRGSLKKYEDFFHSYFISRHIITKCSGRNLVIVQTI